MRARIGARTYAAVLVLIGLTVLPNLVIVSSVQGGEWPMWGQNPQHTSLANSTAGYNPGGIRWTYSDPMEDFFEQACISDDGLVILATEAHYNTSKLIALEIGSGSLVWSTTLSNVTIYSSGVPACAADGTIYVSYGGRIDNDDNFTSCLIALYHNGTEKWRRSFVSCLSAPTVAPNGTVYVTARWQGLYALDPSGEVLWHRSLPGATYGPCASLGKDGEVYVSCVNYSALAFSGNGDMLWGFNTSRDNVAAVESSFPVVATDGTIYAPSVNGLLYALRPDGAVKWTFGGDGERTAWRNGVSLMGNGDLVFTHVSPGTSLIYGGGTNLTRLTAQGQVVWSRYSPISQSTLVSALPSGYIAYDPPGTSFQFLDGNGTLAWEIIGMSSARYSRFGEGMAVASDGTIIAVSGQDIFAVAKGRPTELVQAGAQWQGTDVKINWQPNLNDGGSAISAYQIYRLPPGQSLVWHASESDMAMYLVGVVDGNSTSFIDRGAPNDDSTYLVAAKNSYGMGQLNQFYVEGSWDNGFSATMIALVIGVAVILVLILVLKRYYAD